MNEPQINPQENVQSQNKPGFFANLRSKMPWDNFHILSGLFVFLLLPTLVAATLLGPKIVDTSQGPNSKTLAAGADTSVLGQWSAVSDLPVKATNTALLPNGKVLTWPSNDGDQPFMWDPATGVASALAKPGYNIFCAGITTTADGKIFVPGGHVVTPVGLPHASFYDPANNSWTRVTNMNNGRWYPNALTLGNGDILVTSGTISQGVYNEIPQVYNIRTNKWRNLTDAKRIVTLYPFMYLTSSGKVYMAGNTAISRYLDTSGTGKWSSGIRTNYNLTRSAGTSVMYSTDRILIVGGGSPNPTNTAEIVDLSDSKPKWSYTGSMAQGRRHTNTTILPTGEVLITGGTYGEDDDETKPVLAAEIWSPSTGKWTKVASNTVYRGYHSTALLLPDGRVFSGGGEKSGTSMEIYSPPYLFKGARPTISSAPTQVNYGDKFLVKTPDVNSIEKVRWIRFGAVTHSFNQSQRINNLNFTKKSNGVEVSVTSNPGQTSPGYYMLFILNSKGVPSIAKIIKVGNININLPPPLPSLTPTPQPAGGSAMQMEDHAAHEQILKEFKEDL